ncbi:MAG TPA: hypothetical protein VN379_14400 [Sporomusa sp.]|nr:hypothetical protein [Sporomusa sp.]
MRKNRLNSFSRVLVAGFYMPLGLNSPARQQSNFVKQKSNIKVNRHKNLSAFSFFSGVVLANITCPSAPILTSLSGFFVLFHTIYGFIPPLAEFFVLQLF